jgi:hypothetical protein
MASLFVNSQFGTKSAVRALLYPPRRRHLTRRRQPTGASKLHQESLAFFGVKSNGREAGAAGDTGH